MALQRVVVIVNKKWEAAPILGVFRAPYSAGSLASARPAEWQPGKPYPAPQAWPDASGQYTFDYRYTLLFGTARVECWCLADFEDTSDSGKKVKKEKKTKKTSTTEAGSTTGAGVTPPVK